jgi:calcineurin-like phosphoesterase family protein
MTKKMSFETALSLFKNTIEQEARSKPDINEGMLKLADPDTIEAANLLVADSLGSGHRIWMTSDLHFGHLNIIAYCDRPFYGLADMNDELLSLLKKVPEDEVLVFIGDMYMGDYQSAVDAIRQIPCRKILVVGNHDFARDGRCRFVMEKSADGLSSLFDFVVPFLFWAGLQGRFVFVSHYPLVVPATYGDQTYVSYHGHLHRTVLDDTISVKYINAGWDVSHALLCL